MSTLNVKVAGAWTPIAGDVNATNPVNDFISQNTPTAWTSLTLQGTWLNFGAGFNAASYRKIGDIVEVRGLLKNATALTAGTAYTVANLPVGFRPVAGYIFPSVFQTGTSPACGRVDVNNTPGDIVFTAAAAGAHTYASLDAIRFSTV